MNHPSEALRATFEAGNDFGLSKEQVWEAAKEVAASRSSVDDESLEQVADALARRIEGREYGGR